MSNQEQQSEMQVGMGFKLPEELATPPPPPPIRLRENAPWVKGTPQIVDQDKDPTFAHTVRLGPVIMSVYDLLEKPDVQAMNKLSVREHKLAIRVLGRQIVPLQNRLVCHVTWCDLFYQQIIPTAPVPSHEKKRKRKPPPKS